MSSDIKIDSTEQDIFLEKKDIPVLSEPFKIFAENYINGIMPNSFEVSEMFLQISNLEKENVELKRMIDISISDYIETTSYMMGIIPGDRLNSMKDTRYKEIKKLATKKEM